MGRPRCETHAPHSVFARPSHLILGIFLAQFLGASLLTAQTLVQEWEAESLPDIPPGRIIVDAAASGGSAVACVPGEPVFRLNLTGLNVGMYAIQVYGRVTDASIPQYRKPMYIHLRVDQGGGTGIREYRMRCGYLQTYQDIARIFFYCFEPGDYAAEVFVGQGTVVSVLVDRLQLLDALGETQKSRLKQRMMYVTPAERERLRALERANPRFPTPWRVAPLPPDQRAAMDEQLWRTFPPLNSMRFQRYSGYFNKVPDEVRAAYPDPVGDWTLFQRYYFQYPFKLTNSTLGLEYTYDDLIAYRPLPAPWPWPDDGMGFYFDPAVYTYVQDKTNANYCVIGNAVTSKYDLNLGAVTDHHGISGPKLALRYHLANDTEAARDGAFLLAIWALQYPGLQELYQNLERNCAIPNPDYGQDWRFDRRRDGKLAYYGWATEDHKHLLKAYDQLYDYIATSQELANALRRYIPWIQTPDDVVRLIDMSLLDTGVQDSRATPQRLYSTSIESALCAGPDHPVADSWMEDFLYSPIYIYPYTIPYVDQMRTNYTRDGSSWIGSTYYTWGPARDLVSRAMDTKRYVNAGGNPKYDLSDADRYPKTRVAPGLLLDTLVAGCYSTQIGNVGTPDSPREWSNMANWGETFMHGWRLTGEPRFAWLLKHVYGRTIQPDDEWAAIEAAAATTRDPRLHQSSRVLGGFGLAVLESGQESDDYRFKRTVTLRTSFGRGHKHNDPLDLQIFATGVRMAPDIGGRFEGEYKTRPSSDRTKVHNLVEVDKIDFANQDAWIEVFAPCAGAQFMSGRLVCGSPSGLNLYRRAVALIDVDEGVPPVIPPSTPVYGQNTVHDPNAVPATSYVFDVVRVSGRNVHTWCFHGPESDDIILNTELVPAYSQEALEYLNSQPGEPHSYSYRNQREGVVSGTLEVIWPLNRDSERAMLGADYNPNAPRRYLRARLFGHDGELLLVGNAWSDSYNYDYPFVYVRSHVENTHESVFPALYEPYQGTPFIAAARELVVTPNEGDARRAVALRVETTNGHVDTCFSDDRPETERTLEDGKIIQARLAYYLEANGEFRLLHLVEGTRLKTDKIEVRPLVRGYTATIAEVDYDARRFWTAEPLPERILDGKVCLIENGYRFHSRELGEVRPEGGGSVVTYPRATDEYQSAVVSVNPATGVVTCATQPAVWTGNNPNWRLGLTATNEARSRKWRCELLGESNQFKLTGPPVAMSDFTDEDGDGRATMQLHDFGPGDRLHYTGSTRVEQVNPVTHEYRIETDVPVRMTLPLPPNGIESVQVTTDGGTTWQDFPATIGPDGVFVDVDPARDGVEVWLRFNHRPWTLVMAAYPPTLGTTLPAPGPHEYPDGTIVEVSAEPLPGYVFDHWDGDVADPQARETTVTMNANKTATAVFAYEYHLDLREGWNLVSIPIEPVAPDRERVFPPEDCTAVWEYALPDSYVVPAEIRPKRGYWVKATRAMTLVIRGFPVADRSVSLHAGWNLVGPVGRSAAVPWQPVPPCIAIWEYQPPYRIPRQECREGRGYWIKAGKETIIWAE